MKVRGAALQGALAGVGLLAAYFTWQRPPDQKELGEVVVVDASKSALQKVRYRDAERWLELERRTEGGEPAVWLRQGGEAKPPPAAPAADGGTQLASTPPAEPLKTKELRGNERAEKAYERFAPLKAVRALGVLPEDKLRELGLVDSGRELEVTVGGVTRRFLVNKSQGGASGSYLRDEKSGQVYLLAQATLVELEPSSQQLVDRRLHAFKWNEFDAFELQAGGKAKAFVVEQGSLPQQTKVAPKAAPTQPDEFVRNWHDKVWNRLLVTEVLSRGELPAGGAPQVGLRIEYAQRGKSVGFLELGRAQDNALFARSEQTTGWVKVHAPVAEEVLVEAQKVVAASGS